MERINSPGATAGNLFTDGDPGGGIDATVVWAAWLNQVQEEIANVIEGLGVALDGASDNQLYASIFSGTVLRGDRFNDTSHGNRSGGSLHALADSVNAGFMSPFYVDKLNGITAGARPDVPTGARALFYQLAAPTGWVQDVSVNDRVIRVTNGPGGAAGGSWTISGISIGNTTLTESTIGPHGHPLSPISDFEITGSSSESLTRGTTRAPTSDSATASAGGGASHGHTPSHDGSWRPAYADCVVCIRN